MNSWNLKLEKAETQLSKAEGLLDSYSSEPARSQKSRLTQMRQTFVSLRLKVKEKETFLEKAATAANSPAGQAAKQEFENLARLFHDFNAYLINVTDNDKLLESYRVGLEARTHLRQKYAPLLTTSSRETFDLRAAAEQAERNLEAVQNTASKLKRRLPPLVNNHLQKAEDYAKDLERTGAYSAWETNVERELDYARIRLENGRPWLNLARLAEPRRNWLLERNDWRLPRNASGSRSLPPIRFPPMPIGVATQPASNLLFAANGRASSPVTK